MRFWQDQQSGILQSTTQSANALLPVIYMDVLAADFNIDFSAAPINMLQDSQYGIIFRVGFALPQGLLGTEGGSQVRLEVLRDHFRLFINDRYVTTFVSATLADPGLIGLVLGTSQTSATKAEDVRFGNLAIYAPGLCP